jgi:hypothetical protein
MTTSSEIFLHCCCGPCSLATIDFLTLQGYKTTAFFYNPNIEKSERDRRKDAWEHVCKLKGIRFFSLDEEIDPEKLESERCGYCFETRLRKTNEFAVNLGINNFTTSLLISPFQKHELLIRIGQKFDNFRYFDFRPSFQDSQAQATTLQIYRQKFCGCVYSKEESKWLQKRKEEMKRPKLGPCEEWRPKWL